MCNSLGRSTTCRGNQKFRSSTLAALNERKFPAVSRRGKAGSANAGAVGRRGDLTICNVNAPKLPFMREKERLPVGTPEEIVYLPGRKGCQLHGSTCATRCADQVQVPDTALIPGESN